MRLLDSRDTRRKLLAVRYHEYVELVLTIGGTICWVICFWWMHRISVRQNATLEELHDVTRRIERLAKEEHDMIREVHPAVEKIKNSVEDVAVAVEADGATPRVGGS